MSLASATEAIRTKVGADSGLAATLKFDCGADGVIRIDGASTPNTVTSVTYSAAQKDLILELEDGSNVALSKVTSAYR